HFFLRFSSKRNSDRVADSFVKQNSKSDGRLDSAAERGAGFSHAEMKRIINFLGQQPISRDGAVHVRSFQRNDDVSEVEVFKNLNMTQRRLDHCFWRRRPVLLQQIFLERTTVHADSNRHL